MQRPIVVKILKKIAPKIGAKLIIEPEYGFVGQIIFKNGRKTFFRNTNFNINNLGTVEIARDKGYAKFFLKKFGYKTIKGQTFYKKELNDSLNKNKRGIEQGLSYAKKLGFPVIVKPNNLSQGSLVGKIYNAHDYYALARKIFTKTPVLLIEEYCPGNDYRIVVLDNQVISAYQRIPLNIIGDGKSTIKKLLEKKQKYFARTGRDTIIKLDDFRLIMNLKQRRLSFNSIIPENKIIYLLDNANLSTGGDAIDVTKKIHHDFTKLAINITKDMGLRLCGVDLITKDIITQKLSDYVIIEINGAPGLDNYAAMGKEQNKIVENLYLKILKALEKDK